MFSVVQADNQVGTNVTASEMATIVLYYTGWLVQCFRVYKGHARYTGRIAEVYFHKNDTHIASMLVLIKQI